MPLWPNTAGPTFTENAVAHSGLGGVLADLGRTEEGLREMREAIRLRPQYADGYYSLGWLLATQGRAAEAISDFQEAIRLDPDDTEAHYNLGTALAAEGRLADAIVEFQAALRLKPDYANAHLNLGKALANSGGCRKPRQSFRRAPPTRTSEAREALECLATKRRTGPLDQSIPWRCSTRVGRGKIENVLFVAVRPAGHVPGADLT
jgi:tetratricopeptide (TPR) repeat protein